MARILLVTWNYPPVVGGIENYVAQLHESLAEAHEVAVLTRDVNGAATDSRVRRLAAGSIGAFLAKSLAATLGIGLRGGFDLLVAGSVAITPVTGAAARLFRKPALACAYGLDLTYPDRRYQQLIRCSLRAHQVLVPISGATRELARERGVDPKRMEIIPPGVSSSMVALIDATPPPREIRARHGLGERPVLLSVGRLTQRKGIHRFLREAFPRILRECPETILVIVGEDPRAALVRQEGELQLILAAVEELGLRENVRHLGGVNDRELAALYRAADLFVFPGLEVPGDIEGFGIVVIEAAAAGTPAVVTRCGGIPDTVEDGVTGLIIPPGDDAAIANAVSGLLRDPGRRAAMGRAARERTIGQFTRAALAPRWLSLVERLR